MNSSTFSAFEALAPGNFDLVVAHSSTMYFLQFYSAFFLLLGREVGRSLLASACPFKL
jgi:hypothetical protein